MSSKFKIMRMMFFPGEKTVPKGRFRSILSHDNIVGRRTRLLVRFREDPKLFNDPALCSSQAFCAKGEIKL